MKKCCLIYPRPPHCSGYCDRPMTSFYCLYYKSHDYILIVSILYHYCHLYIDYTPLHSAIYNYLTLFLSTFIKISSQFSSIFRISSHKFHLFFTLFPIYFSRTLSQVLSWQASDIETWKVKTF